LKLSLWVSWAQARPLSGAGAGALRVHGGAKPLVSPGGLSCSSAGALPPSLFGLSGRWLGISWVPTRAWPLQPLGLMARHISGVDAGLPLRPLGPLARHLSGADAGVAECGLVPLGRGPAPLGCRCGLPLVLLLWASRAPLDNPGPTEGPPGLTPSLAIRTPLRPCSSPGPDPDHHLEPQSATAVPQPAPHRG